MEYSKEVELLGPIFAEYAGRAMQLELKPHTVKGRSDRAAFLQGMMAAARDLGAMTLARCGQIAFLVAVDRDLEFMHDTLKCYNEHHRWLDQLGTVPEHHVKIGEHYTFHSDKQYDGYGPYNGKQVLVFDTYRRSDPLYPEFCVRLVDSPFQFIARPGELS